MSVDEQVSIGQVKRDISQLVNRVSFGGERIVLTSRGYPKAALVSIDDYDRLRAFEAQGRLDAWQTWFADVTELNRAIYERLAQTGHASIDIDSLWESHREERDDRYAGG